MRKEKILIIVLIAIGISISLMACTTKESNISKTDKNDIKKLEKASEKKVDRYVGVFITYGTKDVNENQQKLEKKDKIYGKLKHNQNESLALEFKDIGGVVASVYLGDVVNENIANENVDKEGHVDSILGDKLLDVDIELDSKNRKTIEYKLNAHMKIHNDIDKDIVMYFNSIYMDSKGKLYVTTKEAIKEIIQLSSNKKSEDVKMVRVFKESTFGLEKDKETNVSVRLSIEYGTKEESKYSQKENMFITENEYKKDERLGKDGNLFHNNALDNLDEEYDCNKCLKQVKDYDAYDTVIGSTDTGFKLAVYNYDGDVDYYKEYVEEAKCAKDAIFFNMMITNIENVSEKTHSHDCSFTELSKEKVVESLKDSSAGALLWFNDKKEITKMVLFGTMTIEE